MSKVARLYDECDVLVCRDCGFHVVRVLAELQRVNPLRCRKCNGPLVALGRRVTLGRTS